MKDVLQANVEALEQGAVLLSNITDDEYLAVCEPYVGSTIGQHFRHILDMYAALMAIDSVDLPHPITFVNYDKRSRGSDVEFSRKQAVNSLAEVVSWLNTCDLSSAKPLEVKSEVSLSRSVSVNVKSNLLRELVFIGSHTVHHYALIKIIARLQKIDIDEWFGVAPATVSYLRKQPA